MRSFFTLRQNLAERYRPEGERERFGRDINLDITDVILTGSPLTSWGALLEAARKQGKLRDLLKCIARENAQDRELQALLTDVERGQRHAPASFSKLIDLSSLHFHGLNEQQLIAKFVSVLGQIRKPLLELAASNSVPCVKAVDDALKGQRTADAKASEARYRAKAKALEAELTSRRAHLASKADEILRQIQHLGSLPQPQKPIVPQRTTSYSEVQYQATIRYYQQQLDRFDELQAQYERNEAQLSALRAEHERLILEVKQATIDIKAHGLSQDAEMRMLADRIRSARDQDMIECVDDLFTEARAFLNGPSSGGLDGFVRFLLAVALNEQFRQVLGANVPALTDALLNTRAAIEACLNEKAKVVAGPWLAAVGFVVRTLETNRKHLDTVSVRINSVLEEELDQALKRLARLNDVALPEVPDVSGLLSPSELAQAEQERLNRSQKLSEHLSELNLELGRDVSGLTDRVSTAQNDARWSLKTMRGNATSALPIARGVEVVFSLARRAVPMMGPWVMGFYDSILFEADQRAQIPAEELVRTSVVSEFLCTDGDKLIRDHPSTRYKADRDALRKKEARAVAVGKKLEEVGRQLVRLPWETCKRYVTKFWQFAWFAWFPVLNVVFSLFQRWDVVRLREALGSTLEGYIQLAKLGRAPILMTLVVSVLLMLVCSLFVFVGYSTGKQGLVIGALGLGFVYLINTLLATHNLIRWNSFANREVGSRRSLRSSA